MRGPIFFLTCLAVSVMGHAREAGYALECSPVGGGIPQIISFLEDGVDKNARLLETQTGSFWDSHEWQSGKLIVWNFSQQEGETAVVVSYFEINTESLVAEFLKPGNPSENSTMQCKKWQAKTSNKGINLSF